MHYEKREKEKNNRERNLTSSSSEHNLPRCLVHAVTQSLMLFHFEFWKQKKKL